MNPPPLLGAHFSIAKGLQNAIYEAVSYGCNTLQIFTKNASTWKERKLTDEDIEPFHRAIRETKITEIASHTSYLINLASSDRRMHKKSCHALKQELIRSSKLSIPYVILHPGAHMGKGIEKGIQQIAESINRVFDETPDLNTRLLLETTAGQGSGVGHAFEHLSEMLNKIEDRHRMGVCLDTNHIFAAGYDIRKKASYRQTMDTFDRIIGLENLYVIHLNDSKRGFGSRIDRHHHIGEGTIGIQAFEFILNDKRLMKIPKIIETDKGEKGEDWDRVNLERLRALVLACKR